MRIICNHCDSVISISFISGFSNPKPPEKLAFETIEIEMHCPNCGEKINFETEITIKYEGRD
jgi:hypothetical protein